MGASSYRSPHGQLAHYAEFIYFFDFIHQIHHEFRCKIRRKRRRFRRKTGEIGEPGCESTLQTEKKKSPSANQRAQAEEKRLLLEVVLGRAARAINTKELLALEGV